MNADNSRSNADPDGDDLVAAMNQVRNNSERQVVRLHEQAQRLVDWREYVRSRPYVALGVAVLGGFWLMHRRCPKQSPQQKVNRVEVKESSGKVARASLASGAMAFLGSIASQAIKHYAMNQIRKRMGINNDQPLGFRGDHTGFGGTSAPQSPVRNRNGAR